jgi:hypothetical protein
MRRDRRLTTIIKAVQGLVPGAYPHRLSVNIAESLPNGGAHTWSGSPAALAEQIHTALYGRPGAAGERSPLAWAEEAKRNRDLVGELNALTSAGADLESAPWYPCRPGDLVHVHYEATPLLPAFGETYVIGDVGGGLMSMQLVSHTFEGGDPDEFGIGGCTVEAAECPIYEAWFEAGPHRLTIVRDGRVVHDGRSDRRERSGVMLGAMALAAAISEAQRYLERGEPELALARLRSHTSLPPCGSPWIVPEHGGCARPGGHRGACSDDPGYTEPAHECPALPEQLHAVVTIGAKVDDVHFAGLYEDQEAAADHAAGFAVSAGTLTERHVRPAPGLPGEMLLALPPRQDARAGVLFAVVVPLQVLPDPRAEDEEAAEGMAAALDPDDYADDYRDDE